MYLSALLSVALSCVPVATDPQELARDVVALVAEGDWQAVAKLVHPVEGLRFSPYGYVDVDEGVLLSADQVGSLSQDGTKRRWGRMDGSGEPIEMTASEYYRRFIYDRDFAAIAGGGPNERLGHGNSLNNISEAFSGETVFFDFHHPGSEQYQGMDWRTLRVVLKHADARWYLVGLVHDEWTI